MPQFAWTCNALDSVLLIDAPDEDTAYRIAINHRILHGKQTLQEAVGWFANDDRLGLVMGTVEDTPPFEGDIPDPETDTDPDEARLTAEGEYDRELHED